MDYDDFDWFDNDYLEWYLCKHSRVYYREYDFFDAVGYGTWSEVSIFDFQCQMTLFANDKIRVCYFLPMWDKESALASFYNSNIEDAKKSKMAKLFIPREDQGKMNFIRSNSFRQNLISEFDSEMNDDSEIFLTIIYSQFWLTILLIFINDFYNDHTSLVMIFIIIFNDDFCEIYQRFILFYTTVSMIFNIDFHKTQQWFYIL